MIIRGDTVINNPVKLSKTQAVEEKAQEAFKKIFVEKMISEMFKSTEIIPGSSEFETEVYSGKMSEILADQLLESTDIRWEQILGAPEGLKNKNEE